MSLSTFLILSPFALDAAMTSPHMLSFAGREWYVKDSGLEKTAPGPCHWTSATQAIWSDRYGLHLTIRPRTGCSDWASTEAWSKESFGYGTFRFTVTGAYKHQDPQSTMGGFLWDDDTDDDPLPVNHWHREIDVEISKWGVAANPPVSFTIQPWSLDGTTRNPLASHLTRIDAATDSGGELGPEGGGACDAFGPGSFGGATIQTLTFVILWFPDQLRFAYFDGDIPMAQLASSKLKLLGSWNYMGAKPTPNFANPSLGVHMHFNLWQCNWGGIPDYKRIVHNVVGSFDYSPSPVALPAAEPGFESKRLVLKSLSFIAASISLGLILRAAVQYALTVKRAPRESVK